jgi:hypothetical protein
MAHKHGVRWSGRAGLRQAIVLTLFCGLLAGCGASTAATLSDEGEADPTATFAAAMTQVAGAKAFVATTTAEARASLPTPTATAKPTEFVEPTATPNPFANVVPSPNFEGDILTVLPYIEQLPAGFQVASEGPLTARVIAASYTDEAGFLKQLETWGFRQAAARSFALPRSTQIDQQNKMTVFNSAVIEFGSPEQSRVSMDANRDYVKKGIVGDPPNVTLEGLGDYAIAVQGTVRNGNTMEQWAFIWVQKGNLVLYFRAMSLGYVPMDEAIQIATATLSR